MLKIHDYLNYITTSQETLQERSHQVAHNALVQYGLTNCHIEEIHESSIALIGVIKLRITPPKSSENFLLSIHCRLPYWGVNSTRTSIDAYLQWLLYLHNETEFVVQEPLPNRRDNLITEVTIAECENAPIYCTLHRWVPGKDLADNAKDYLERVGAISAKLHVHASKWPIPETFDRPEYTSDDVYAPLNFLKHAADEGRIATADIDALSHAADRIATYLDAQKQTRQTWGMIHGDFSPNACVLHKGELHLIDIDDCCLGFYIADIGNSFKGSLGRDPDKARAFLKGYESITKLPDNYQQIIEGFIISAWIRNWARWREPNQTFYNMPDFVSNKCKKYLNNEPFLL